MGGMWQGCSPKAAPLLEPPLIGGNPQTRGRATRVPCPACQGLACTVGPGPATARPTRGRGAPFFLSFFFLPFSFFFLRPLLWGLCLQHPHFLKLAPILGSVESSIPHRDWKFHFFPNFIFAKLRVHIDLHIPCWDFRFMKK
jgi:hypothetical protein